MRTETLNTSNRNSATLIANQLQRELVLPEWDSVCLTTHPDCAVKVPTRLLLLDWKRRGERLFLRCWHEEEFSVVIFSDPSARLQTDLLLGVPRLSLSGTAAIVAPVVPSESWPLMVFGFEELPEVVRAAFWASHVQHFGIHGYGIAAAAPDEIYDLLS